jgi:hypothetical protein
MTKKVLLATTAFVTLGASIAISQTLPFRGVDILAAIAPEQVCAYDPAACLQRKDAELAALGRNFGATVRTLQADRQKAGAELDARQRELKANEKLLADGRSLWQAYSSHGRRVTWRGAKYRPEQMDEQLALLFRERAVLEATTENLRKVVGELDTRLIDTRVVGTRISTERGMIGAKVALVRSGQLTANLDRITADIDRLVSEAEGVLNKPVIDVLRTTRELAGARDDAPTAFDRWLREGMTS